MIAVDSCGWIDFFGKGSRGPQYRSIILGSDPIVVPTIVIFEVYKWLFRELGPLTAKVSTEAMNKGKVVSLSASLSILAAQVSHEHKLPLADAIVLATAQSCGAKVATHDQHFSGLDGVEFVT